MCTVLFLFRVCISNRYHRCYILLSLSRLTHTLDDFTIILTLTSKHNQLGILYEREDLASQGSGFFCGEFEGVGLPLVVIA